MRQLSLSPALRTGDVVTIDEKAERYYEVVIVRADGLALVAPWPPSIRKRRSELRVETSRLELVRGASGPEHVRAVLSWSERDADFMPDERAALSASAAAVTRARQSA